MKCISLNLTRLECTRSGGYFSDIPRVSPCHLQLHISHFIANSLTCNKISFNGFIKWHLNSNLEYSIFTHLQWVFFTLDLQGWLGCFVFTYITLKVPSISTFPWGDKTFSSENLLSLVIMSVYRWLPEQIEKKPWTFKRWENLLPWSDKNWTSSKTFKLLFQNWALVEKKQEVISCQIQFGEYRSLQSLFY